MDFSNLPYQKWHGQVNDIDLSIILKDVKDVNLASTLLHWAKTQVGFFQANKIHYNSLLHKCKNNGQLSSVERIWKEMRENGCKDDVVSYNTVIDAIYKAGELY